MNFLKQFVILLNPFHKPRFKVGDVIYNKSEHHFPDEKPSLIYTVERVNDSYYKYTHGRGCSGTDHIKYIDCNYEIYKEENNHV